jgi:hypothetical protein
MLGRKQISAQSSKLASISLAPHVVCSDQIFQSTASTLIIKGCSRHIAASLTRIYTQIFSTTQQPNSTNSESEAMNDPTIMVEANTAIRHLIELAP